MHKLEDTITAVKNVDGKTLAGLAKVDPNLAKAVEALQLTDTATLGTLANSPSFRKVVDAVGDIQNVTAGFSKIPGVFQQELNAVEQKGKQILKMSQDTGDLEAGGVSDKIQQAINKQFNDYRELEGKLYPEVESKLDVEIKQTPNSLTEVISDVSEIPNKLHEGIKKLLPKDGKLSYFGLKELRKELRAGDNSQYKAIKNADDKTRSDLTKAVTEDMESYVSTHAPDELETWRKANRTTANKWKYKNQVEKAFGKLERKESPAMTPEQIEKGLAETGEKIAELDRYMFKKQTVPTVVSGLTKLKNKTDATAFNKTIAAIPDEKTKVAAVSSAIEQISESADGKFDIRKFHTLMQSLNKNPEAKASIQKTLGKEGWNSLNNLNVYSSALLRRIDESNLPNKQELAEKSSTALGKLTGALGKALGVSSIIALATPVGLGPALAGSLIFRSAASKFFTKEKKLAVDKLDKFLGAPDFQRMIIQNAANNKKAVENSYKRLKKTVKYKDLSKIMGTTALDQIMLQYHNRDGE